MCNELYEQKCSIFRNLLIILHIHIYYWYDCCAHICCVYDDNNINFTIILSKASMINIIYR